MHALIQYYQFVDCVRIPNKVEDKVSHVQDDIWNWGEAVLRPLLYGCRQNVSSHQTNGVPSNHMCLFCAAF